MTKNTEEVVDQLVEEGKLDRVDKILESGGASSPPPEATVAPSLGVPAGASGGGSAAGELLAKLRELVGEPGPTPQEVALAKLREAFPPYQISSLPKETKKQREEREKNRNVGIRCALCTGWHHRDAMHVPYVGHAAITDRLLEVDPFWKWEPLAWTPEGLPRFDASGGMWIKLTVAGMTRLGYGHGAQKPNQDPGAREKEVIGDALRNAAMRFGAALELWHKGDLHGEGEGDTEEEEELDETAKAKKSIEGKEELFITDEQRDRILTLAASANVEARTICDRYGIDALPQLHAGDFEPVIASLKATLEKRRKAAPAAGDDLLGDQVKF